MPQLTPEQATRLAHECHQAGRLDEAAGLYLAVLQVVPDSVEARNNLGNVRKDQGRLDDAVAAYRLAIASAPAVPEPHFNLGTVLLAQRKFEEAAAACLRAIELRSGYTAAHCNLGIALAEQGKLNEAIAAYRHALALGEMPQVWNNLGNALKDQGSLDEAIGAFRAAIASMAGFAEAHANLGGALKIAGKLDEALAACIRAIELKPNYAPAHVSLGGVLKDMGRLDEAAVALRQAIELQPDFADAHVVLGNALKDQGLIDDALAAYDRALALRPSDARTDSNRVYLLNFHPRYDAQSILGQSRRWNDRHAAPLRSFIQRYENDPSPERRLKIGYVSPDFRDHAQSLFTLALLRHHDRGACEVYCYSDVAAPDAITDRLKQAADVWRVTTPMSDARLAGQIRDDRIDVVVDLTAHTGNNRLLALALKPAPVQVTWLGYPGTTGLSAMDWRISDPYLDPPGAEAFYAEQTLRLPETYWCYGPLFDGPAVNELPARKNGGITFGCLNNFCKINNDVLNLWSQVLRATPMSRLLIVAPEGSARARVLQKIGVDPGRIRFFGRQSRDAYFALYHQIDISLDTFPYNGHTTSLDSLWMGVPIVTRIGKTAVGRAGLSQLANLGLGNLAADGPEGYIQIATALAADLSPLAALRASLRQRMQQSPLRDARRLAHHMEAAYRQMWRKWCLAYEHNQR